MTNQDIIDMASRAADEIEALRGQIARLAPKAEAYETVTAILRLLPQESRGYGEDVAWRLRKQIDELKAEAQPAE